MEPPVRTDSESIRDEKVKVLQGDAHAQPGRHRARPVRRLPAEPGVAAGSQHRDLRRHAPVHRFLALAWTCPSTSAPARTCRVTCTEVLVRLKRTPSVYSANASRRTMCACASAPTSRSRMGMNVLSPQDESAEPGGGDAGQPPPRRRRDGRLRARARRRDARRRHAVRARGLLSRRPGASSIRCWRPPPRCCAMRRTPGARPRRSAWRRPAAGTTRCWRPHEVRGPGQCRRGGRTRGPAAHGLPWHAVQPMPTWKPPLPGAEPRAPRAVAGHLCRQARHVGAAARR